MGVVVGFAQDLLLLTLSLSKEGGARRRHYGLLVVPFLTRNGRADGSVWFVLGVEVCQGGCCASRLVAPGAFVWLSGDVGEGFEVFSGFCYGGGASSAAGSCFAFRVHAEVASLAGSDHVFWCYAGGVAVAEVGGGEPDGSLEEDGLFPVELDAPACVVFSGVQSALADAFALSVSSTKPDFGAEGSPCRRVA